MAEVTPPGTIDDDNDFAGERMRKASRKSQRASVRMFLEKAAEKKYENQEDMFEDFASSIVDETKRAKEQEKRAGYWKKMSIVISVASIAFFGLLFGLMVASNELSKESHVTPVLDGKVGNAVVAGAIATKQIPLEYLPVMDVHTLSSIIGQSIMYTRQNEKKYEIVTAVSKPKKAGTMSTTVYTDTAELRIDLTGATLIIDGVEEPLWGSVTCALLKIDMQDVLDTKLEEALGKAGVRRLQASKMMTARRLAESDDEYGYEEEEEAIWPYTKGECVEMWYWPGNYFAWNGGCTNEFSAWWNAFYDHLDPNPYGDAPYCFGYCKPVAECTSTA